MRSIVKTVLGISLTVAIVLGAASAASAHTGRLGQVKQSLHRFKSVSYAQRHGFGLVTDVNGVSCIDDPAGTGNMGYHYANPTLLGDGKIDPFHPEAVLYEHKHNGFRLTAIEYIVIAQQWTGHKPPRLFGHEFMLVVSTPTASACPPSTCCTCGCGRRTPSGCSTRTTRTSTAHDLIPPHWWRFDDAKFAFYRGSDDSELTASAFA